MIIVYGVEDVTLCSYPHAEDRAFTRELPPKGDDVECPHAGLAPGEFFFFFFTPPHFLRFFFLGRRT